MTGDRKASPKPTILLHRSTENKPRHHRKRYHSISDPEDLRGTACDHGKGRACSPFSVAAGSQEPSSPALVPEILVPAQNFPFRRRLLPRCPCNRILATATLHRLVTLLELLCCRREVQAQEPLHGPTQPHLTRCPVCCA